MNRHRPTRRSQRGVGALAVTMLLLFTMSFSVTLAEVAGDPGSVQLTAWGCIGQGTQCVPGSAHGAADATARVSIILKLKPLLRVIPAAAVTAGGAVDISGPVAISNLDLA